jgi:hypothetical protein
MAAAFDPFEILGVRPDATYEQIRAAYRDLVARYHPDKHRGNPLEELAAAKLVDVNRAYEILSDDGRRAAYEATRSREPERAGTGSRSPQRVRPSAPAPSLGMKLVRSLGLVVTLVFFARFGIAIGREVLAVVRGLALGVLWLMRMSPVFAVAVVCALALGAGLLLRSRKGNG